ncbi:hypothetical protein M3P05_15270 [Sansalvadorimonas sp. 2012CJ34-2]|uniref:Uncharacterized protein n=1 Tax=Parendozoicomonas callyspongiae TaxID=2942213 RepID=A0ABT0PJX6_9GAMM|nr:hypothetical protein [Sansalvadorimonas sp. 2012CJ34-2]MCL6271286.1 hypothetical protein [Sansalvadorimonas sp. 2012CJ34-2]
MGVNLNGGPSSVSPKDSSPKLQHPTEGKSSHHKVTVQTGKQIVGVKLQLATQGQKALHERATTLAEVRDTWLLERGSGISKKSTAIASDLVKSSAGVDKKEQKLNEAIVEYKQAAARFEAKLEQQAPDKELKSSQKKLENTEKRVVKAGADLNQELTALEKIVQEAGAHKGKTRSVLRKLFDPPPDKWFGKQDKAVLEIRQQELELLSKDFRGQLSLAQGKQGSESEVRLLKQQLSELSTSSKKLHTRIGKNKKFHQGVVAGKKSEKLVETLKSRHADFRAAIKELGASRTLLDQAIRTDAGTESDKTFRKQAESRHKQAETNVSEAAKKLRQAENNYISELRKDRNAAESKVKKESKAAAQESKKKEVQVSSIKRGKTEKSTSRQEYSQATVLEPKAKADNQKSIQPKVKPAEEPLKPQDAPKHSAPNTIKDLEKHLLAGHEPRVKALLGRVSGHVQAMKTPEDVIKQREYLDGSKALPEVSKTILMRMMNRKIMSLMQNPDFAIKTGSGFVDDTVYGRQAQEKISLVRLDARVKRPLR